MQGLVLWAVRHGLLGAYAAADELEEARFNDIAIITTGVLSSQGGGAITRGQSHPDRAVRENGRAYNPMAGGS